MWSGVGIPKAETEGRSRRCSYATPHEVITSYRLPDKGCFAFISHCFMIDCKISTFFHFVSVWDDPFPAPTFISALWLLWRHTTPLQHKQFNVRDEKGWDSWKGRLIKFIINTIIHSLVYWTIIGLYFIRYIKKNTFIWYAICGEIVLHTGDLQQIIAYLCIYLKSREYTHQWDIMNDTMCLYTFHLLSTFGFFQYLLFHNHPSILTMQFCHIIWTINVRCDTNW